MIINIATKPLNKDITISTCSEEAKIYLYVNQKNCTINETSDNYCQQCITDYGKIVADNKCYHKSEKFSNLYYDNPTQSWKECETNKNNFKCSICPKGTYIKDSSSQICEKCDLGFFNNLIDSEKCEKCMPNFFSDEKGASYCKECEENKYSLYGFKECLTCEQTIPHCSECSKAGICLKCNNKAVSGFDNCTICENTKD